MTISTRGVRGRGGPSHRRRLPRLFRTSDWRVRTKLAAALTIPAVAFVVVVGVGVVSSVRQAESLQRFTRQVHLSRQVTALVHEMQRERDHTAGVLAGVTVAANPADQDAARVAAALAPDRAAVDRAAAALRQAARPVSSDPAVRAPYQLVDAALRQLDQVRAAVRDGWLRQDAVFSAYSRDIHALIALLPEESRVGAGGETLGHHINSLTTLAAAKELTDQVRGRLYALTIAGRLDATGVRALSDLGAQRATILEQFSGSANPSELGALDEILHSPQIAGSEMLAQQAIGEALVGRLTINPQNWWDTSTGALELIRQAEKGVLDVVVSSADERSFTRWRGTALAGGLALAILIGVLLTSWGIGRSLARSLRLLREQALDVAARRLPEAIERLRTTARGDPVADVAGASIDTADEIGQVAQAFTAVHRTAVRLAVEQAMMRRGVNAMFVNLARRSQTLVERQLQLLDNLESSETDPDQLSSLFRLDHLATRMRRNDENLLVLAGADNSRRWTEPVALSAVVLAAVAEIEQYPRIRHDVTDEIYIVGHAVADVVHLLAELLENATTFSPPDTPVTVTGWRTGDANDGGDDGGGTILIADTGLGMSVASIVEANQQLATPSSIDVATSERMGLLVVANLAARQQITVELGGTERGVQAQVSLPARILAPPPLHEINGPFGTRTLPPSDEAPTGAAGMRRDMPAIAATGIATAPFVGTAAPAIGAASVVGVAAAPAATAPAAVVGAAPGVVVGAAATAAPMVTIAGNAASIRRTVARTIGTRTANGARHGGIAVANGATAIAAGGPTGGAIPAPIGPRATAGGTPPNGQNPGSTYRVNSSGTGAMPIPAPRTSPEAVDASVTGARPAGPSRRSTPTRAEDILSAATSTPPEEASRWWSRTGTVPSNLPSPASAIRTPIDAGTSDAGLPIRVPMAQLPGEKPVPTAPGAGQALRLMPEAPDPSQVSSVLTQFYSGVHRATAEELRQQAERAESQRVESQWVER